MSRDGNGDCTSLKRARSSWHYEGLSSHAKDPDPSLAVEGIACTSNDDCCPDNDCDFSCNYVVTEGFEAGTGVEQICTLQRYAWCTRAYTDREDTDVSGQDFIYLDRCNGIEGTDGYAYHATGTFPYLQACFHGEPAEQAAMGGPPGGGSGPP